MHLSFQQTSYTSANWLRNSTSYSWQTQNKWTHPASVSWPRRKMAIRFGREIIWMVYIQWSWRSNFKWQLKLLSTLFYSAITLLHQIQIIKILKMQWCGIVDSETLEHNGFYLCHGLLIEYQLLLHLFWNLSHVILVWYRSQSDRMHYLEPEQQPNHWNSYIWT